MSGATHGISATLTPSGCGTITISPPTNTLTATLAPFFKGDNGYAKHQFETVSKNLDSNSCTPNYVSGKLSSITYETPDGEIIKTLSYTDGLLTSVSLSGSGLPSDISLTKTISYTNGVWAGNSYD